MLVLGNITGYRFQHTETSEKDDYHSIIKDSEKPIGIIILCYLQFKFKLCFKVKAQSMNFKQKLGCY